MNQNDQSPWIINIKTIPQYYHVLQSRERWESFKVTTASEYKQNISHETSSNNLKKGYLIIKQTLLHSAKDATTCCELVSIIKLSSFIIFSCILFPQENG